ncbi:MAG: hypothetical protein ACREMY_34710, partial [bacterium]
NASLLHRALPVAAASRDLWPELHDLSARHAFGPASAVALAALVRARDAYFASFGSRGVGEAVMRKLIDTHYSISPEQAFHVSRRSL